MIKNKEKTQLMYILDLLKIVFHLTPKCHPEIAGCDIEYAQGYSKLRFRTDFNDGVAINLRKNVIRSLDTDVLTLNIVHKFARKAREYKLTYTLLFHLADGEELGSTGKDEIEYITRLVKTHRLALDSDCNFIFNSQCPSVCRSCTIYNNNT